MENNYPYCFVFSEGTDSKGNRYRKAYSNKETKCVIAMDRKNVVLKGRPNIFLRVGESKFGDELCFYFKIQEKVEEYETNSKHEDVEFYLPMKEGIEFLEKTLQFLKKGIYT